MTDDWQAGAFSARTSEGEIAVAGWLRDDFALDFRLYGDPDDDEELRKGWHLTHLRTGHAVCALLAPLVQAQQVADEIAACADWAFDDAANSTERSEAFRAVKDRFPKIVVRQTPLFSPFWVTKA